MLEQRPRDATARMCLPGASGAAVATGLKGHTDESSTARRMGRGSGDIPARQAASPACEGCAWVPQAAAPPSAAGAWEGLTAWASVGGSQHGTGFGWELGNRTWSCSLLAELLPTVSRLLRHRLCDFNRRNTTMAVFWASGLGRCLADQAGCPSDGPVFERALRAHTSSPAI